MASTSLGSPVSNPSQFCDFIEIYAEYALCIEGVLRGSLDGVPELGWDGHGTNQGRKGTTTAVQGTYAQATTTVQDTYHYNSTRNIPLQRYKVRYVRVVVPIERSYTTETPY